jgi:hypothetical protein
MASTPILARVATPGSLSRAPTPTAASKAAAAGRGPTGTGGTQMRNASDGRRSLRGLGSQKRQQSVVLCAFNGRSHSLPGGVGLVAWTILAVINWCLRPYALLGLSLAAGVGLVRRPYWLSSIGRVLAAKQRCGERCQPSSTKLASRAGWRRSAATFAWARGSANATVRALYKLNPVDP